MPKRRKKHTPKSSLHNSRTIILITIFLCAAIFFMIAYNRMQPAPVTNLPSTVYSGTTPCADCTGIKTTLTLSQNPNNYSLNLNYEGKNTNFTEKGIWSQSTWKTNPPKTVYTLVSNEGNKTYYQVLSSTQIRQLDGDGNPIPDNMPFTLTKE